MSQVPNAEPDPVTGGVDLYARLAVAKASVQETVRHCDHLP